MCLCPINLSLSKVGVAVALKSSFHTVQVPCGHCLECRRVRVNSWFVRLLAHFRASSSSAFVTFTYDDAHLPFSDNGLMTLRYRDFQLFCKRARKAGYSFKYYCAGEYGDSTSRPHFHVLFFSDVVTDFNKMCSLWTCGHVNFGVVREGSIYYTLKYIDKAAFACGDRDADDDRASPRGLMSKGLGLSFLSDFMARYFHDDPSRSVVLRGGGHVALPRYYRDKLFSDSELVARRIALSKYVSARYELFCDPLFAQRVVQMYRRAEPVSKL